MSNTVKDLTDNGPYWLLSQTPGGFSKNNYYLKELQDKINQDWAYRPNRATVEYEATWGKEDFLSLEVVVQRVKNDKGKEVSDDYRHLVFKDIRESRFRQGSLFRFASDYDATVADDQKNFWLTINTSRDVSLTSAITIQRCNGTLGSVYTDSQNVQHFHYEPALQATELTRSLLEYNSTAIQENNSLLLFVQHNSYTSQYTVNQRFIIGYDKVYRIKGIDKFNSLLTADPNDVGLMALYLEVTNTSEKDDFVNRIADQGSTGVKVVDNPAASTAEGYAIKFVSPTSFPSALTSSPVSFEAYLYNGSSRVSGAIDVSASLGNFPSGADPSLFFTLAKTGDNAFTLSRARLYTRGALSVVVSVPAASSPTGKEISASFSLIMSDEE